jgi:hypothetical protein
MSDHFNCSNCRPSTYALLLYAVRVAAAVAADMQAAPLWDSSQRKFVGLMTVTDFIDILRHYSHRGVPVSAAAK